MSGSIWNSFFALVMKMAGKDLHPGKSLKQLDEFFHAIFEGNESMVTHLLNNGRSVNEKAADNSTVLCLAVEGESLPVLRILLSAGADVNESFHDGFTALHLAVNNSIDATIQNDESPGSVETAIIEYLLEAGADIEATDDSGRSPLDIAKSYGSVKVISLLQSYG